MTWAALLLAARALSVCSSSHYERTHDFDYFIAKTWADIVVYDADMHARFGDDGPSNPIAVARENFRHAQDYAPHCR